MDLKNDKTNNPKLLGSTTINHSLRLKVGLNCSEYVMADCLYNFQLKRKEALISNIYNYTGFSAEEQKVLISALIRHSIIFPPGANDKELTFTPKWLSEFETVETEFEEFWSMTIKDEKEKEKVVTAWPGSKVKAKDLYVKLRKKHTKDYLIQQRNDYFRYLDLSRKDGFDRQKMMATVFLGKSERFAEDWEGYGDDLYDKLHPSSARKTDRVILPSSMNLKDKTNLYAEDTDKSGTV